MAEHSEDFAQRIEMALRTGNRTRRDDVVALLAAYERLRQRLDEIITAATSGAGSAAVYAAIDRAALSGSSPQRESDRG